MHECFFSFSDTCLYCPSNWTFGTRRNSIGVGMDSLILRVLTFSKALLLFCVYEDELELRYKLHSSRDVEVLWSRVTNLADGCLHAVTIRRLADTVSVQVNTPRMKHAVALR